MSNARDLAVVAYFNVAALITEKDEMPKDLLDIAVARALDVPGSILGSSDLFTSLRQ